MHFFLKAYSTQHVVDEDFLKELQDKYCFSFYRQRWLLQLYVPTFKHKYLFLSNSAIIAQNSKRVDFSLLLLGPQQLKYQSASFYKSFQFSENPEEILLLNEFKKYAQAQIEMFQIQLEFDTYVILVKSTVTDQSQNRSKCYIVTFFQCETEEEFNSRIEEKERNFKEIRELIDNKTSEI